MDELRRELRGDASDDSISSVCVSAERFIEETDANPTKELPDEEATGECTGDASDRGDAEGKSVSMVCVELCWDFTSGDNTLSRPLPDEERP